jgi:glucan-binding YG repeat protein
MAKAINDAIAALELNGASYAEVNKAIAAANALNKANYVDFSAVDAAVAAVVSGLDITKQAEVDAMADAILAAIDALVYVDGIITENGKLYYVENGEKVAKGLVKVGDNNYYFTLDFYALEKGEHWLNNVRFNGITTASGAELASGMYVVNEDCTVQIYDGLVKKDDNRYYYYENGLLATNKGLVKVGEEYYYFGINSYALNAGEYWFGTEKLNGIKVGDSELKAGKYVVNEDCSVQILDGIVNEGNELYYYENGVKVAKGLVYDEASGNYYYFGINYYALGDGQYWFSQDKLNGLAVNAGIYTVENGVVVL